MNNLTNKFELFVPLVLGSNGTNSSTAHRYRLASNKVQKIDCPYCGAKKHWQRYIDIETGEILPDNHGRCDNSDKCGKWITPKDTGYAKTLWEREKANDFFIKHNCLPSQIKKPKSLPSKTTFFDSDTYNYTLQEHRYKENIFIQNLMNNIKFPFEVNEINHVIQLYKLGTISKGYRIGAVTFPFIDFEGNIRAVQVKQFDEYNHTKSTDFLHSIMLKHYSLVNRQIPQWLETYSKQQRIVSCLFGEQLLNEYRDNPVALVEAPKTAIYGALYFGLPKSKDSLIWLAVFNKSSFSFEKLKVLEGRKVFVFPDLSKDGKTFNEWRDKANEYEKQLKNTRFIFSDLLEKYASDEEKNNGLDIADFLIQQDWRKFRNELINEKSTFSETKTEKSINELKEIAEKIIGKNNSLRLNEIPNAYQMIEKQTIKLCKINNAYYLHDSTPF